MKTIVVSDTALAGLSYNDTLKGIDMLCNMQEQGNKVIITTNDPDYSICQIGGNKTKSYRMSFQDYSNISRKEPGIDIILYDQCNFQQDIIIKPDYTIIGNGIQTLDRDDIIINSEKCIDKKTLENIEETLHQFGYSSLVENMPEELKIDVDTELTKEDVDKVKVVDRYKFFTPKRVIKEKSDDVYAVVCDSRISFLDGIIVEEVQKANEGIAGCIVDDRPYFYQEEINKLKAFKKILKRDPNIDLDETYFILDSITDAPLMGRYAGKSYCLDNRIIVSKKVKTEESLTKVLEKIK